MSKSQTLYKIEPNQVPLDNSSLPKRTSTTKSSRMRKRAGIRQYSVYLRESTHRDTKISLLMQGTKQDFSGLVEQLLTEYLEKHKK